jgi:hypothetical protein
MPIDKLKVNWRRWGLDNGVLDKERRQFMTSRI